MNKFNIITLYGSTKFEELFHKIAEKLTLDGYIVLMPHIFSHSNNKVLSVDK